MTVVWTRRAEKARDAIALADRERIVEAIERFAATQVGDVKRLRGSDEFRLRVGDYRVRFSVADGVMTVLIVSHRREAYR